MKKIKVWWVLSYTFTDAVLQSWAVNSTLILTHSRKTQGTSAFLPQALVSMQSRGGILPSRWSLNWALRGPGLEVQLCWVCSRDTKTFIWILRFQNMARLRTQTLPGSRLWQDVQADLRQWNSRPSTVSHSVYLQASLCEHKGPWEHRHFLKFYCTREKYFCLSKSTLQSHSRLYKESTSEQNYWNTMHEPEYYRKQSS